MKKLLRFFLILLALTTAIFSAFFALIRGGDYLPAPTGSYPVGRVLYHWLDPSRPEDFTPDSADRRELTVAVWYPAQPDSRSRPAAYFPNLERLADALAQSGEVNRFQQAGLTLVKTHTYDNPPIADLQSSYPLIVFSPGAATNAAFYTLHIEDLVSHGYIVAAIDHPYDSAAVLLTDGSTAVYDSNRWPHPAQQDAYLQTYRQRVLTRAADMRFVLDQLTVLTPFAARIDLTHVAAWGHSIGGVAAAQACIADTRFTACLNMDGLIAGLPYLPPETASQSPAAPSQPLRYLGKPLFVAPGVPDGLSLAVTRLDSALADAGPGSDKVIIEGASHQSFSDSPLLIPAPFSTTTGSDLRLLDAIRRASLDFFARFLV